MTKFLTSETTHPWISFQLDPVAIPNELWLMLGECESKCEHIAGVPLRPEDADAFYKMYLIKGARATTAIEGNTLSEEQVRQQVDGTLKLPESQKYLALEVKNIAFACSMLVADVMMKNPVSITPEWIQLQNHAVLASLRLPAQIIPGQYRKHAIAVGMYRGVPHEEIAVLMSRMCEWITQLKIVPQGRIVNALVQAVVAHLYLAWIHPFGDGNGRTARLIEYAILVSGGVPAPAAHLLSNHYNLTRSRYYQELEKASISGGDLVPFLKYAVEGFRDGLRLQIHQIHEIQRDAMWRDYVFRTFGESTAEVRRRNLLLDLTKKNEFVPLSEIAELSPRLALGYAGKNKRTIARDIEELRVANLISFDEQGCIAANTNLLSAWLPLRAESEGE